MLSDDVCGLCGAPGTALDHGTLGCAKRLRAEVARLRSELEQVKRERDEWRTEAAKARESIAAMRDRLHGTALDRDALAATVEALREAAREYMDALGWGVGDTEAYDAIDPEDVDRFNAAAVALRGILDKTPTAHLSERDARVRGEAIEEAEVIVRERIEHLRTEEQAQYEAPDGDRAYAATCEDKRHALEDAADRIRSLSPLPPKEEP